MLEADGTVRLRPAGRDDRARLRAALWTEILLARLDGTWRLLKLCANPLCASAFYDTSRNNSGVWHDVRTCGNQHNLRVSRARRATPHAQDT